MAVNFNILQPPKQDYQPLMGSAPSVPQSRESDPLGDLTNGIFKGLMMGQQYKQSEQDLALGEQKREMMDITLREAKYQESESQKIRNAALQGVDAYRQALPPDQRADFDIKMSNLHQQNQQVKKNDLELYNQIHDIQMQFAGSVAQGRSDEERAKIWNINYQNLPKDAQKNVPPQYDPNNFTALMSEVQFGIADHLARNPQKREKGNPLQEAQRGEEQAQQELKAAQKSGDQMAIAAAEKRLAESQQYTQKQATPTKLVNDPVDVNLARLDAGQVETALKDSKAAQDVIPTIQVFRELNKNFKTGLGSATRLQFQQGYETLTGKKLKDTQYGEALQSGGMDFIMKRIANSKGAISEKEMEAFDKASPGLRNSQAGNTIVLNVLEKVENRKIQRAAQIREYYEKNRSLKGFDEQWNQYIKNNPIVTPEALNGTPQSNNTNTSALNPAALILQQRRGAQNGN